MMNLIINILIFLNVFQAVHAWHRLVDNTFAAPFTKFDTNGARQIGTFRSGGHTELKEHFIRLTADRQSKQGYVWGSKHVNVDNWSVVLGFRVSGQGRTLFGDGLVFWFTDMGSYRAGNLFGIDSKFNGFAVILDTFKNTETAHVHKDISVLMGKGDDASARLNTERAGCDANFRYYEGADNFKAAESMSHLKITFKNKVLTVAVDQTGDGKFKHCFSAQNVLPETFDIRRSFYGLSATTGQLADNHDVLSFNAYELELSDQEAPNPELHHTKAAESPMLPMENPDHEDYDPEAALRKLIKKSDSKTGALVNDIKHDFDHKLSHMRDEMKKLIGKLKDQEDKTEGRVKTMEDDKIGDVVKELKIHLEERLQEIGGILSDNVEQRLQELESHFEIHSESIKLDVHADLHTDMMEHTENTVKDLVKEHLKSGGGSSFKWFMFLTIFMLILFGGLYYKFNKEIKRQRKFGYLD